MPHRDTAAAPQSLTQAKEKNHFCLYRAPSFGKAAQVQPTAHWIHDQENRCHRFKLEEAGGSQHSAEHKAIPRSNTHRHHLALGLRPPLPPPTHNHVCPSEACPSFTRERSCELLPLTLMATRTHCRTHGDPVSGSEPDIRPAAGHSMWPASLLIVNLELSVDVQREHSRRISALYLTSNLSTQK